MEANLKTLGKMQFGKCCFLLCQRVYNTIF